MLRDVCHFLLLCEHLNLLFLLFRQRHKVVQHVLLMTLIDSDLILRLALLLLFVVCAGSALVTRSFEAVKVIEAATGRVLLIEVAGELVLRRRVMRDACLPRGQCARARP